MGLPYPSRRKSKKASGEMGRSGCLAQDSEPCAASVNVVGEVAVVTLQGALTIRSLALCRDAVDQALIGPPHAIILDLQSVGQADSAVPVLGLIRRFVHRHGIPLWLAGAPTIVLEDLTTHGVMELYRAAPSVTVALEVGSP